MTAFTPTAPEFSQTPEDWTGSPFVHVKRVLVKFLKGLHAQCPVGGYRWMPDDQSQARPQDDIGSEIWIGMDNPINPNVVGDRPAVTILRGPGSFQGVGINDMAFMDARTGGVVKMDILPVTLTVNILSRIPLEAESLAWFEAKHIWAMREEIMKGEAGIMYLGNRLNISPPSPAGSLVGPDTEHNWVVCSISIPTYLQTSMTKIPLTGSAQGGPMLEQIEVNMTAEGPPNPPPPAVAIQGSALFQPKATSPATSPSGSSQPGSRVSVDPADIGASLPPGGESEGQSTESKPLAIRVIVD